MVDGRTRLQAFVKVIFPLLAPGLMATSLFGFITAWNEFPLVLILNKDAEKQTPPPWLSQFQTAFGDDWGATMAASSPFALPILILFIFLQRKAVSGLTDGAVKDDAPDDHHRHHRVRQRIRRGRQPHPGRLAVLQPGFDGTTAPDWVRRRIGEGLASVALFGRNVVSEDQVTALTAHLRAERDDLLIAIDEESGDVTRLDVRTGSSFPGNHASAPSTTPTSPAPSPASWAGAWPPAASPSTGRPPPTSTPTRTTPSSASAPSARAPTWWPGTPPPGSRACSPPASPPAPSTSPDTVTPTSTRTTRVPRIHVDADTLYERELPPVPRGHRRRHPGDHERPSSSRPSTPTAPAPCPGASSPSCCAANSATRA